MTLTFTLGSSDILIWQTTNVITLNIESHRKSISSSIEHNKLEI